MFKAEGTPLDDETLLRDEGISCGEGRLIFKSEAGPFWGVRLGGCVLPTSPFGRCCFPTSSVWVAVLSYPSPFRVVLGVVLSFTLFCSFDTKKQLYEVKLRHNYSKLKEIKKVKLWAARPPHFGWCSFPPSSLFGSADLVGVAFQFLFGVVWFSSLRSFWVVFLYPSSF